MRFQELLTVPDGIERGGPGADGADTGSAQTVNDTTDSGEAIQITAERAGKFVASDNSGNLMTSLDAAIHKLEQQLKKHKEKVTNHRNAGRRVSVEMETQERPTTPSDGLPD